jgi:hypothetical protein
MMISNWSVYGLYCSSMRTRPSTQMIVGIHDLRGVHLVGIPHRDLSQKKKNHEQQQHSCIILDDNSNNNNNKCRQVSMEIHTLLHRDTMVNGPEKKTKTSVQIR